MGTNEIGKNSNFKPNWEGKKGILGILSANWAKIWYGNGTQFVERKNLVVSEQVRHKLVCAVTEDG